MDILRFSTDMQSELIRELSAGSSAEGVLAKVVDQTASVLKASACTIFIIDDDRKGATQVAGTGYQRQFVGTGTVPVVAADDVVENPAKDEVLGISGWILSTGRSFLAHTPDELKHHPHYSGALDAKQLPDEELRIQTFLGVPLRGLRGEVTGLLKAERRIVGATPPEPFQIDDQITLETAARVASKSLAYLAIAQADPSNEAITARARWAREVIADATTTEGELDSFLDILVRVIAATMSADSCAIYLIDERKNTLTQRAGLGFQAPVDVIRSYLLPSQDQIKKTEEPVGLTAWIAATGLSHYARNFEELSQHEHHRGKYDEVNFPARTRKECGAFFGVPLKVGGVTIGVLKVENVVERGGNDTRYFSEEAQRRVYVLAQDIALAIIRFQQQSRARYKVISDAQDTIFDILRGGLDLPRLVERVVEETAALLHARACALFLKEGNRLIQPPWAAYGWAKKGPEVREYRLVEREAIAENPERHEKVGLTVWIAVTREKFTAWSNLELTQHPHHKGTFDPHNFEKGERCESFMGVPLLAGDELVGVLKVETKMRRIGTDQEEFTYFSEQDELVFDLIANSAAIAIENAKLLESRRLAEHIAGDPQWLLPELHKFVQNNWHAADTLKQTADHLHGTMGRVAEIVENYAGLLQFDFRVQHLEAILKLVGDNREFLKESRPASDLYEAFLQALRADSLAKISRCCSSPSAFVAAELSEPGFTLTDAATNLLAIFRYLSVELKDANGGISRVSRDRILRFLAAQREGLEQVPQPERNILERIIQEWSKIVEYAPEMYVDLLNPYIIGKPINPDAGTQFFGRQDIFDWVAENLQGRTQKNTLILRGEWRMGKTSILLQLQKGSLGEPLRTRAEVPLRPIFVDLQALGSPSTFEVLYYIARQVEAQLALRGRVDLPARDSFESAPSLSFEGFMTEASELLKDELVVLMLDEFDKLATWVAGGKVDPEIYGQLRHQMQHLSNVAFILASSLQIEEGVPNHAEIIHNVSLHKEVSFLDEENARELVERPVSGAVVYEKEAVDQLLFLTNCHPYLLQHMCYDLIDEMKRRKSDNFITLSQVNAAAERLIQQDFHHLDSIWRRLDEVEQDTFHSLATLSDHGQRYVAVAALEEQLDNSPARIGHALSALERRQLVEKAPSGDDAAIAGADATEYRPTIPLFCRWLLGQLQSRLLTAQDS